MVRLTVQQDVIIDGGSGEIVVRELVTSERGRGTSGTRVQAAPPPEQTNKRPGISWERPNLG